MVTFINKVNGQAMCKTKLSTFFLVWLKYGYRWDVCVNDQHYRIYSRDPIKSIFNPSFNCYVQFVPNKFVFECM